MIKERLAALRALMKKHGIWACIVPGTDPHASEYMAEHWTEMSWITGFLGETGTAVITLERALLWTDSRYYLQAEAELQGTTVELMRESDIDCPSIPEWLVATQEQGTKNQDTKVAVNPEMYSVNGYRELKATLEEGGLELVSIDLISPLWTEGRPAIPTSLLYEYEEQYTGESVASKLARVRQALSEKHCDALVVSALDEIGWLLNIRGKDVDYTPCLISYVVVEMDKCTIFVAPNKLDDAARAYLQRIDVCVQDYEQVFDYLKAINASAVMYDGNKVNEALFESINSQLSTVNCSPSPVLKMQSVKNETELQGERIAMHKDAVALTRFLSWLENEALKTPQTEITLAEQLGKFRAMGENYTDDSFCTIAGWKGNGAIVHYHATPEECATIEGEGVLLLDSGGQYLDGTTDITRTIALGPLTDEEKTDYTLVLKGHLQLQNAHFPAGTCGTQLDVLARIAMWKSGINYLHGTGHGIGHFLCVHEGPHQIRMNHMPTLLEPGMIVTDEPGIYKAGRHGIRIENTLLIVPAQETEFGKFYQFEPLTLCPIDKKAIVIEILTDEELTWLNEYHQMVYDRLCTFLNEEENTGLKEATSPLKR